MTALFILSLFSFFNTYGQNTKVYGCNQIVGKEFLESYNTEPFKISIFQEMINGKKVYTMESVVSDMILASKGTQIKYTKREIGKTTEWRNNDVDIFKANDLGFFDDFRLEIYRNSSVRHYFGTSSIIIFSAILKYKALGNSQNNEKKVNVSCISDK